MLFFIFLQFCKTQYLWYVHVVPTSSQFYFHCTKISVCLHWPVFVATSAHILHSSKTTRNPSKAVEVVQDGASCLQVVRVSCGLEGMGGKGWDHWKSRCVSNERCSSWAQSKAKRRCWGKKIFHWRFILLHLCCDIEKSLGCLLSPYKGSRCSLQTQASGDAEPSVPWNQ